MAIGFPAYHEVDLSHSFDDKEIALCLTRDTFLEMNWREWVEYKNNYILDYKGLHMPMTLGERMIVKIKDKHLSIRSESVLVTQFLDFGKNKRNVEEFVTKFNNLLNETNPKEI